MNSTNVFTHACCSIGGIAVLFFTAVSGGPAMAGIVYYENPAKGEEGHFNWHWQGPDDPETFENWLDITMPSTDQFELRNGNSVGQLVGGQGDINSTFDGAAVARVPTTVLTRAFAFGENVADGEFNTSSTHAKLDEFGVIASDFEEGVLAYIGVRTENGNFGWISVIRTRYNLETQGWAYETEPGVPILAGAVPTGATAAPLLMLPFFRRSRSRKHS